MAYIRTAPGDFVNLATAIRVDRQGDELWTIVDAGGRPHSVRCADDQIAELLNPHWEVEANLAGGADRLADLVDRLDTLIDQLDDLAPADGTPGGRRYLRTLDIGRD